MEQPWAKYKVQFKVQELHFESLKETYQNTRHQSKPVISCGDYNRATSYRFVKILEFTHFCSFFNFGRTDVKRHKKQIVDRIHVVVGYRVDTRDTIFFDE